MTNKEILFKAIREASEAYGMFLSIQEDVDNMFCEDSPLSTRLANACGALSTIGNIDYELFGGNFSPREEELQKEVFMEWLEEDDKQ